MGIMAMVITATGTMAMETMLEDTAITIQITLHIRRTLIQTADESHPETVKGVPIRRLQESLTPLPMWVLEVVSSFHILSFRLSGVEPLLI